MNVQDLLDGLARFRSAEIDTNNPPTCQACGDEYTLIDYGEPVAFCNECTHKAVDVFAGEIESLRAQLAAARQDIADAAGVFSVPMPRPGTDMSKMMIVNATIRSDRDDARKERDERYPAAPVEALLEYLNGRYVMSVHELLPLADAVRLSRRRK